DAGRPAVLAMASGGPEKIAVEFVEASATQAQFCCSHVGGDFIATEGGKDFADQRCTEAVEELTIMFFIAARMAKWRGLDQRDAPTLRAFRRPPLRSGLLQARRAGGVRLCPHTCPGLNAHCSPLLATR